MEGYLEVAWTSTCKCMYIQYYLQMLTKMELWTGLHWGDDQTTGSQDERTLGCLSERDAEEVSNCRICLGDSCAHLGHEA